MTDATKPSNDDTSNQNSSKAFKISTQDEEDAGCSKWISNRSYNLRSNPKNIRNSSINTCQIFSENDSKGVIKSINGQENTLTGKKNELIENDSTQNNSSICQSCGRSFGTARGLQIHGYSHATVANTSSIARMTRSSCNKTVVNSSVQKSSNVQQQETHYDSLLQADVDKWKKTFENIKNHSPINTAEFDEAVASFLRFLVDSNERLPGPVHPAVKFYRLRKQRNNGNNSKQSRTTNPQRSDTNTRKRRNDRYNFELMQYLYYNHRRKVVRKIMNSEKSRQCKIDMKVIEDHFKQIFETSNDMSRQTYEPVDLMQPDIQLEVTDIEATIKGISLDTAPGPDRILMRTIKELKISKVICIISNIMLSTSYVPTELRQGRTVLIDKGGTASECTNWRPITIYSIIRRIIERALDRVIRNQIQLNCNQRGFVSGIAGCHINTKIIDAILKHATDKKRNCVVAFLDISKAFDRIGHRHIELALKEKGVSSNIRVLIMNLLSQNSIIIETNHKRSNKISINCGVPQGGPLSPILFNIAIDHIYNEICEPSFSNKYGYNLHPDLDSVALTGFADDQVITGESVEKTIRTIELVSSLFGEIGLSVNPKKA